MDPKTLRQHINANPFIVKRGEDTYEPWSGGSPNPNAPTFTLQDVTQLDERLAGVLTHEFRRDSTDMIQSWILYSALQGWEEPAIAVLRGRGSPEQHEEDFVIRGVLGIEEAELPGCVRLNAEVYTLRSTADGLSYNRDSMSEGFDVQVNLLDATFPDWKKRFDIAESLSLSPRQTAELMFMEKQPALSVDMSNVTFE